MHVAFRGKLTGFRRAGGVFAGLELRLRLEGLAAFIGDDFKVGAVEPRFLAR